MAFDPAAYGASEFKIAIKNEFDNSVTPDGTIGAANTFEMQYVNVDSVSLPELNPVLNHAIRSGSAGRIGAAADVYESKKGIEKTITFSGIADTTVIKILVSNALTGTIGVSPAGFSVAYNYTPPELLHGAASDATKTLTCAVILPETDTSIIFPGCTVTQLILRSGGIGEESGRMMFDCTLSTRYIESLAQTAPTSPSVYGTGFLYLTQLDTTRKIAGIADCVLGDLSIEINNPSVHEGTQGTDGDPATISRSIPELEIFVKASVKFDVATKAIIAQFGDGGTAKAIELSNHVNWSDATGFGVKADLAVLMSPPVFNDKTSMYLDVELKIVANTGGDTFAIIV